MAGNAATESGWRPTGNAQLDRDDVHVWRLALAPAREQLAKLASTLSADERGRAARFHFERDRIAFTAARGALRTLIGRYLGHPPARVVFGYRDKGKPFVAEPDGELRFNLSHSGELALLAFACSREIGVDIERRRPLDDPRALANISFSRAEYATLCSLPLDDQPEAFFSCWARKEAFIKATGEGVSQLADFDVTMRPGEPARLLRVPGAPAQQWSLHDLPAIPGYAAALVTDRMPIQIACWDWPPDAVLAD